MTDARAEPPMNLDLAPIGDNLAALQTVLGGDDSTTTRSDSVMASSRSCVTITTVWPSLRQISISSLPSADGAKNR